MSTNLNLSDYDNLSIQLFSALAENALGNISSSAGKMLDVACLFFDKDVSAALQDFHTLYLENSQLDEHKTAINQQADDILEAAQNPDFNHNELPELNEASEEKINQLANIQKNLEALIQQDEYIKLRMVPVMQCMQYEDMISNRIKRLIQCWELMVSLLEEDSKKWDASLSLQTFYDILASEDEHQQFFESVLESQPQLHSLAEVKHNIKDVNTLLERLLVFSQISLNHCIEQTQQAFDELLTLLNLVTGESKDVAYLFTDQEETFKDIKMILSESKGASSIEAKKLISQIESTKNKHSEEASDLIQSFMVALQSQDIIRQNIENIGRFHHSWSAFRNNIKKKGLF